MPKYKIENTLFMEFLKGIRRDEGFTNESLAAAIHHAKSSYNGYESGQTKNIHTDMLNDILTALWEKYKKNHVTATLSYDAYICRKISKFIMPSIKDENVKIPVGAQYSKDLLKKQYWLLALHLSHAKTKFTNIIRGELETIYGTDVLSDIISSLNANPTIKQKFKYDDKNAVYIKPLTQTEEKNKHIPLFKVCYEMDDEKIKEICESIENEQSIYVYMLFDLIFNFERKKYVNEQEAVVATCTKLNLWNVPLIYNILGLLDLPKGHSPVLYESSSEVFAEIRNILECSNIPEEDTSMQMFKNNFINHNLHYLDAIAIDFSFINNMSEALLHNKLHEEIENAVKDFRKEYLHDTDE